MTPDINTFITGDIRVNEAVTPNEDGSYTIFINDNLGPEARIRAYMHALRHIQNHDFEKSDVSAIELDAHDIDR